MKIGIDFDDVLLDANSSLAQFHNARYGTSYERKDVRGWLLHKTWGCTEQEVIVRIQEWYHSFEHANAVPVLGALAAIRQLASLYELHIVTSRPDSMKVRTLEWLSRHFPNQFSGLHFTNHFVENARSKAEVCRNLKISLLIEDAPPHAYDVAASGATVLLLDCPWNQDVAGENIVRVSTWGDIVNYLVPR